MTKQKIKAHLVISDGYGTAIIASQWISELQEHCDEHNAESLGDGWRSSRRRRAVVTVEFEVDDDVFNPEPIPVVAAAVTQEGEGS